MWRPKKRDPLPEGLQQLNRYLDKLKLDRGTLVVFDRRGDQPAPHEHTAFSQDQTPSGRPVTVLRA